MSVFCRGRLEQYSDSLFQFLNECAQSAHFVKKLILTHKNNQLNSQPHICTIVHSMAIEGGECVDQ